jgi:hypothetical protein
LLTLVGCGLSGSTHIAGATGAVHSENLQTADFSQLNFTRCFSSWDSAFYAHGVFENGCPCSYCNIHSCSAQCAVRYHPTDEAKALKLDHSNFYNNAITSDPSSLHGVLYPSTGVIEAESCVFSGNPRDFSPNLKFRITNCVFDKAIPSYVTQVSGNRALATTASFYLYPEDRLVCVLFDPIPVPEGWVTASPAAQVEVPVQSTEKDAPISATTPAPESVAVQPSTEKDAPVPVSATTPVPESVAVQPSTEKDAPVPGSATTPAPESVAVQPSTEKDAPGSATTPVPESVAVQPSTEKDAPVPVSATTPVPESVAVQSPTDIPSKEVDGDGPVVVPTVDGGKEGEKSNAGGSPALGAALGAAGGAIAIAVAVVAAFLLLRKGKAVPDEEAQPPIEVQDEVLSFEGGSICGEFRNPNEIEGEIGSDFDFDVHE